MNVMVLFAARCAAVFVAETSFAGKLARSVLLVCFGLALFGIFQPLLYTRDRYFVSLAFSLFHSEKYHFDTIQNGSLALVSGEIAIPQLWAECLHLLDVDRFVLLDTRSGARVGF